MCKSVNETELSNPISKVVEIFQTPEPLWNSTTQSAESEPVTSAPTE